MGQGEIGRCCIAKFGAPQDRCGLRCQLGWGHDVGRWHGRGYLQKLQRSHQQKITE